MDFLNSHFASVSALAGLDDRIGVLQAEKAQLLADRDRAIELHPEPPKPINTREKSLNEKLERLRSGFDVASALTEVELLAEKNADLAQLQELSGLYKEKQNALNDNRILAVGSELEKEIGHLAHTKDGTDINTQIASLDKSISNLKTYDSKMHDIIVGELRKQLNAIIAKQMKKYEKELSTVLKECKWLSSSSKDGKNGAKNIPLENIHDKVATLIQLQAIISVPQYPTTWSAIDILLEIVIQKFNYHFNAVNKETNKLLKPEWAFNYIELFLEDNLELLEVVLGESLHPYQRIASYEIITTLLKPLREKIFATVKQLDENIKERPERIEKNGRLLSHLIFEVVSFDQRIRNAYNYNPYIENIYEVPKKQWEGITSDLLLNEDTNAAQQWFEFEHKLAERRFESEILNAPNAHAIEYDYRVQDDVTEAFEKRHLKPTVAAYNLIKLFDNLTNHYQTISIVKYQLKYFSNIQLMFIDKYLATLTTSLKKFDVKFNFIPGSSQQPPVDDGTNILETLVELYCLGKYVEENLQKRSELLIFVELWDTFKAIDSRSSYELYHSLFDTTIQLYNKFLGRVQDKITDYLKKQGKNSLKKYVNTSQWDTPESEGDLEPSGDLRGLIVSVLGDAELLRRALSDLEFSYFAHVMLSTIAKIFQEFIITNNRFSVTGVEQLSVDYHYILSQIESQLLLHETSKYSIADNQDHLRVLQSIAVLGEASRREDKSLRKDIEKFRAEFESHLAVLTNRQIDDLLQRVV